MIKLKSNQRASYRLASPEDIKEIIGAATPFTCRALAFFWDEKLQGLGGYKWENGHYVVFSDFIPNEEIPKLTIYKCAKIIIAFCKETNIPMYVVGGNFPLFESLGMQKINDGVYLCHH